MSLFNLLQEKLVDYNSVVRHSNIVQHEGDLAIIIPVAGRIFYNQPVTDYFYRAWRYYQNQTNEKIRLSITIVEHSDFPEHKNVCRPFVNYIHIPRNGQPFNKCLAFNIGAIEMKNHSSFLFHDVDIIVPKTFFINLVHNNLNNHVHYKNEVGFNAIQAFTKKRLLHADSILTQSVLNNTIIVDNFSLSNKNLSEEKPGAAGGSIYAERKLYIECGGWTDSFFTEYSIEDQFFYDKVVLLYNRLLSADNPSIELIHLDHPPSFNRQTKKQDWDFFNEYQNLTKEEKIKFIEIESRHLKNFMS